ncbi:MAG: type II CAAX endopeptidase family protein [Paracoccaceae bacterium]
MIPHSYQPLVAPAMPTRALWRLGAGILVIMAVYVGVMVAIGLSFAWWLGLDGLESALRNVPEAQDPVALLTLLGTFIGGWIGLAAALRAVHKRKLGSVMGRAPIVLRDFALGVALMVVVGGGLSLFLVPMLPPIQVQTPPETWFLFLVPALLGILIQTGAEEAVFRGYIQSQIAARFPARIVWLVIPNILFGLAHFSPDQMGQNTWLVVLATGMFGLYLSDLTARTGSLGLAWGLHFANNVIAILIVNIAGALNGLALLGFEDGTVTQNLVATLLIADLVIGFIVWVACRIWLRRR